MEKRRVLLVCSQHLLGESLENVLRGAEDVELLGPWNMEESICTRIAETHPHVVIVADEDLQSDAVTHLATMIIEQYPDLSVIRAGLTENVFRVSSTHLLPARGVELLETIRGLPAWEQRKPSQPEDR